MEGSGEGGVGINVSDTDWINMTGNSVENFTQGGIIVDGAQGVRGSQNMVIDSGSSEVDAEHYKGENFIVE